MSTVRKAKTAITLEMVRTAKRLIEQDKTTKEISNIIDLSKNATIRLIKNIIENGDEFESKFSQIPERRQRNFERNSDIKRNIENFLICDNSLTQKAIMVKLNELGISISQSKISKVLKEMGYSRKRLTKIPEGRNTEKNLDERRAYTLSMSSIQDESLVFIDETGFNLHTSLNYGYSPKSQREFRMFPSNKGRNLSVLVAISLRGVIAYEMVDGPINSELFRNFILNKLYPKLELSENILFMDNTRIHKTFRGCGDFWLCWL